MGGKVVPAVSFGNEGTQLDVLDGHFLAPYAPRQDMLQFVVAGTMPQGGNLLHLLLVEVVVQSLQHAVEGDFRRIGYEGEDSMVHIVVNGFQYVGYKFLTQQFTFPVNVHITAPAKIDALEGTRLHLARLIDLHGAHLAGLVDKHGLSGLQLLDGFDRNIKGCLYHGTFAGKHRYLVVLIPEGCTDAPWVAYGESLSAAGKSAHHVSPVPLLARSAQYVGKVDVVFYITGDVHACQPFRFGKVEEALHFAVEAMSQLLQHDVGIGIFARMLADGGNACEDFIHIRHVEVAAEGKILGTPVVSPEERVHVRDAGLSGSGVTQVSHIDLPCKGQHTLGIVRIVQLFLGQVLEMALHRTEDFGNGARAESTLTEHIFLAGTGFQFHAGQSGTFLPTVVLFLHQEIELVESVHPCSVLLFIVLQRFQQAYHGNAAFMLQLFHLSIYNLPFTMYNFKCTIFFSLL